LKFFANEPFAVFSQREECQGGGLSLPADLTQDGIVRFWVGGSQEFLKASGVQLAMAAFHTMLWFAFTMRPTMRSRRTSTRAISRNAH